MISLLPETSAALVGNSGCLLDEEGGESIDSHSFVMRLNNFELNPELGVHVGHRTDAWVSSFFVDMKNRKEEFGRVFCPFPVMNEKWGKRYRVNKELFERYNPECAPVDMFEKLIETVPNPSTGMAMIWWMYSLGVTLPKLYGFSFFQNSEHHYFNGCKPKNPPSHNGVLEMDLVTKIYKEQI